MIRTPAGSANARAFALVLAAISGAATSVSAQSVGPQVRVDPTGGTFAANETTASASEFNPNKIIAGWNDWRRSSGGGEVINAGFSISTDGGVTWTDQLVRPPAANQSGVEGDPMSAYDDRTGTLWAGAISFASNGGIYVARLDPNSSTFAPSVMARRSGGTDKCWMAAGPIPGNPNTTRLYITYNEGVIWSDDLGATWTNPLSLGSGIGFLPRVGPNGEVYVAYWDFSTGVLLKRSFNGGSTFDTVRIATRLDVWSTQDGSRFPGNFRVPPINYIAVDPNDGTLYCVYFDTTNRSGSNYNVDLYFTKSSNQGAAGSWSTPRVLANMDAGNANADQFFPWIEVDATGRLLVMCYDGRNTVQNDSTGNVNGIFDTYFLDSTDGGTTWNQYRLATPGWNSFNDGLNRSQQFIGDYNAMAQAGNKAYPVYLDSRAGDPDIYTNVISYACSADWNGDGTVDSDDFFDFLNDYNNGNADFNGDGVTDSDDFFDFLNQYNEGC